MACLGKIEVTEVSDSDGFRAWISRNLAPIVFLSAYFFTVVLGNIIYLIPSLRSYLDVASYTSRIFGFETLFSLGYWVLLLAPFLVTPLIVYAVRRTCQRPVRYAVGLFPEFTRMSYMILLLICYGFVFYAFWRADVFRLFFAGGDFISSVEARFEIRERVNFVNMALLMSNLHFLSIYAAVRWVRAGGWWWGVVTLTNAAVISMLLISLNMKWPIIIFYVGLVMAIFVYTKRHAFIKTLVGLCSLFLVYFLISAFVYRLAPVQEQVAAPVETPVLGVGATEQAEVELDGARKDSPVINGAIEGYKSLGLDTDVVAIQPIVLGVPIAPLEHLQQQLDVTEGSVDNKAQEKELPEGVSEIASVEAQSSATKAIELSAAIADRVPMMMFHAINRMAIIYPYYYEIFTRQGQACGGLLAQAQVGQKCRPSFFVYQEMFEDQFGGRGTAPAAVHVTAYALGGWPLAAVGLICASVLLGLFASLPLAASSLVGAMAITGGIVGYHLSQLPGEGPLFYDHGIIWTALMLIVYAILTKLWQAFFGK